MVEVPSTYRAVEILQTSATVAAIALALAALTQDEGPVLRDVQLIPTTLLLVGFVAVISSEYAVAALHQEMGLTLRDLIFMNSRRWHYGDSVIFATSSLHLLGAVYLWIFVEIAP